MIVSLLTAATLALVPFAIPAVAAAQDIQDSLCSGASLSVTNSTTCTATAGTAGNSVDTFITNLVNVFSVVVGVVAVIMIIIGGFRYITSGGDSNNISSAKNTIIYAIIGLIVVALAQFIVQFVLGRVGNLAGGA
jgi:cytochrome bd-type quinol oxidase subunit 2